MDADETMVLQSIQNTATVHFKTGFTVTVKASTSREVEPDFIKVEFDDKTNEAIVELHLAAAEIAKLMGKHPLQRRCAEN